MARRLSVLVAAVLALAVGGCSAKSAEPAAGWRTPAPRAAGQGGGGAAAPSPTAGATTSGHQGGPGGSTPGSPPSGSPTSPAPGTPSASPTGGQGPFGAITRTGSASVALTFDDGPGPYTGQLLDLLDRYHVKATFCLIGRQVQAYAAVVRRMAADGMTLCNHTWDHDERLRTRTPDQIRNELVRTNQAIQAVVPGAKIEYFRNPGGAFGSDTVAVARSLGMKPLMWNVDPRDWAEPGTQAIIANVLRHTHRGSIVLSHDGGGDRSETIAAYRVLVPNLNRRFQLVPLPVA